MAARAICYGRVADSFNYLFANYDGEGKMKIKLLPGYPTYNFKLTQMEAVLLAGFIFCCVTVLWLAYSVNAPIEHYNKSYGLAYSPNVLCMTDGKAPFKARIDGMCYMEDAR